MDKPDSNHAIGLELEGTDLKGVQLSWVNHKPKLDRFFEIPIDPDHVKPLYIDEKSLGDNLIITSLSSNQTLVRPLEIKLKKERDIDSVLTFQAEPVLPFPAEKGVIDRITLDRTNDGTQLTILAARKDHLQKHLDQWSTLQIEPEAVTCEPAALVSFANTFFSSETTYYIVHLGLNHSTCIFVNKGKLIAAQTCLQGINSINHENCESLRLEIIRILYSLGKQTKGIDVNCILVTGVGSSEPGLPEKLLQQMSKTICAPEQKPEIDLSVDQLQKYAIPLGAALSVLPKSIDSINFRKSEYVYPHPWKRLKKPIALYITLCLALALAFYIFGESYLGFREDGIKKEYVDLLTTMNKPYKNFENEYLAKFPSQGEEGEIVSVKLLTHEDIQNRLRYLEKELQSTPDMFPLLPNVPRVSDVLAWLSNHSNVVIKDPNNNTTSGLLQLESFSYTLVKRPEQTKKQEKYQVKVELEFSTPTPKLAREFHDALIAPNEMVDPKGEVKWSSNRGKYRTSFMLKDKTTYPGHG